MPLDFGLMKIDFISFYYSNSPASPLLSIEARNEMPPLIIAIFAHYFPASHFATNGPQNTSSRKLLLRGFAY